MEPSQWELAFREARRKFVWIWGVLIFGVPSGFLFMLCLVMSDDLANHPLWEKILLVAGMTVVGGPIAGWFFGHLFFAVLLLWGRARRL